MGRLWEINQGPSSKRRFLYDGDAMVEERNELGTILGRYVHGGGIDNPLVWYDGSSVNSANRRHLFTNWQGSITAITDDVGTALIVNAYDAYGIPNDTNITDMRFSYTGQIWLNELGLYHYKARVYSPTLGRFLQTDPIGYEDQYNLYAYVGNDPANSIDPMGMAAIRATRIGTADGAVATYRPDHRDDSSANNSSSNGNSSSSNDSNNSGQSTGQGTSPFNEDDLPGDIVNDYRFARDKAIDMVTERENGKEVAYSMFRGEKYGEVFTLFKIGKDGEVEPILDVPGAKLIVAGHVHNRPYGAGGGSFFGIPIPPYMAAPGPSNDDLGVKRQHPNAIFILHERRYGTRNWRHRRY